MKKIQILGVAVALLVLTGCADKTPSAKENSAPAKKEVALSGNGEGVSSNQLSDSNKNGAVDANSLANSTNTKDMAALEKDFASLYFAFDKFDIDADNKPKVPANASLANGSASKFSLKLEGNCDEFGSDEYNIALGLRRAETVKKAIIAEGVDTKRITLVSYGESNPACTEKTKECWAKNRRVDFKLLP